MGDSEAVGGSDVATRRETVFGFSIRGLKPTPTIGRSLRDCGHAVWTIEFGWHFLSAGFGCPVGTCRILEGANPAMNRGAIIERPAGTMSGRKKDK